MPAFKALNNRISFTEPPATLTKAEKNKLKFPSTSAPFQKFRWIHVLRNFTNATEQPFFGDYQYRITPRYFTNGALDTFDSTNSKDSVTITIDAQSFEKEGLEVAFTRGF